jgi:hypothetical protein
MPGSISDFKSSFSTDVARPNRFDIEIPIPLTLLAYYGTARQLPLRCEKATFPDRTISTFDQKIYGPAEKFPYQSTYNTAEMTFILSDDMSEKEFFDGWMELINPSTTFNFKYKGDYVTDITVNQYDVKNELSYSVDLIDAFPISINQLDLDWSSTEYHKLTVTFAFTYWKSNSVMSALKGILTAGIGGLASSMGGLGG